MRPLCHTQIPRVAPSPENNEVHNSICASERSLECSCEFQALSLLICGHLRRARAHQKRSYRADGTSHHNLECPRDLYSCCLLEYLQASKTAPWRSCPPTFHQQWRQRQPRQYPSNSLSSQPFWASGISQPLESTLWPNQSAAWPQLAISPPKGSEITDSESLVLGPPLQDTRVSLAESLTALLASMMISL